MNQKIKISQLPAKGSNLAAADLLEIAEFTGTGYISKSITGQEIIDAIPVPPSGITIGTTAIASGVVGRVLFEGAGNVVQESSSLSFDDTAKAFTLSGNQNTPTVLNVSNTTSGTAANAILRLTSDSGAGYYDIFKLSTTFTTYKTLVAKDAGFYNTASGGDFSFLNDNASGRFKIAVGASSTAQFIVQSTGNVGINTTTDAGFKFDVNGTARISGNSFFCTGAATGGNGIGIGTTSLGTIDINQRILVLNASKYPGYTLGTNTGATKAFFNINGDTNNASLGTETNSALHLFSNSIERMRLTTTGNLLINTTTDDGFRLDVNGTARVSSNISGIYDGLNVRNSAGASNAQARIKFDNDITPTQTTTGGVVFYTSSVFSGFPSSSFGLWNYNSNGVIAFATNSTERLRIFSTGNVGINTTTDAGFRLDVNGTARVQNGITTTGADSIINTTTGLVRLQKNGADYVYINNDSFALRLLGSQVTMNPILGISIGALYDLSGNYSGYRGVNIRGTWTLNLSDTPDTSARLQVDSTTRGFLPPRMTTTQKNAIATPAAGLMVYDTTLNVISYYNGTMWI